MIIFSYLRLKRKYTQGVFLFTELAFNDLCTKVMPDYQYLYDRDHKRGVTFVILISTFCKALESIGLHVFQ